MLVVAIMMTVDAQQSTDASHRHVFRPSLAAVKPAVAELMKAPRVISDDINCWRVVEMFQPISGE